MTRGKKKTLKKPGNKKRKTAVIWKLQKALIDKAKPLNIYRVSEYLNIPKIW